VLVVALLALGACDGEQSGESSTTSAAPMTTTPPPTTSTTLDRCRDAFCIEYHIHPDAEWADGTPVTSTDFVFTFETIANPEFEIDDRAGYDRITGYEIVDDKTVLFSFSEVYGPWQSIFSTVLPAHILEGRPINTVWDEEITMGSGPFQFVEWIEDDRIILRRNPGYWSSNDRASGESVGDVQELHFVFVEDDAAMIDDLDDELLDVVSPLPDESMVPDLEDIQDVVFEVAPGTTSEHINFNHDDPLLSQRFIRQAIAQGIDRPAILEQLVNPIDPDAEPLGNTVVLQGSDSYVDHFNHLYPYDPLAAEQLLIDNGCLEGSDGFYSCAGQRLLFRWSTTAAQEHREIIFDLAQQNLAEIGIEVVPTFAPTSVIISEPYIYGDSSVWQVLNVARNHFADASNANSVFHCEGDSPAGFGFLNFIRYCNEEVDSLVRSSESITDPVERDAVLNQADAIFLEDVAIVPLYQRPSLLAWNSVVSGPRINPSPSTDLWNVSAWSGKEIVTVGIVEPPESLQILEPQGSGVGVGESTAMIVAPILQGAFALTPNYEYVPVLIESAELIVAEG
jgi:peptide/nickel transport system substrate-binding protein